MKTIFVVISLLLTISGFSQEIDFNIEQLESNENYKQGKLLYAKQDVNGDIYVVTKITGLIQFGYFIQHFSEDLKFIDESFIEIHKSEVIGLLITEELVSLIQFRYNFDTKKYDLSIISSNKEELNFIESVIYSIERGKIDKYENFGFDEKPENPEFNSTDIKKYGFFQEGKNERESVFALCLKNNSYTILRIDRGLKVTEIYSVSGDKKRDSIFEGLDIDENGDVYFLERKYNNNSSKKYNGDKVNYSLNLHKFSSNSNHKTLKIDLDKNVVDVKILNNENYFSLGGLFYTEHDNVVYKEFIGGMFRANIDKKEMNLDFVSFIPFSHHLRNNSSGEGSKKSGGLFLPSLKGIFLYKNGDILMATEGAYKASGGLNDFFSSHDDLFLMKAAANGQLIWDKLVQKIQGPGLGVLDNKYLSYLSNLNEDKCVLVFNSYKGVKKNRSGEPVFKSSAKVNSWTYLLQIDSNGTISYKSVSSNVEGYSVFAVKSGIFINENTLLVQGNLNGDRSLFKIAIQ